MSANRTCGVVAWGLLSAGIFAAPATRPARQVPDLCDGCIAPLNLPAERTRFFAAAGRDNELDAGEFAADRKAKKPFARAFDTWAALRAHDKDGNGTLDWFEAEAYRMALAKRVVKAYDASGDGRLAGAERDKANRALAAGRVPAAGTTASRTAPRIERKWPTRAGLLRRFDADGDGRLSDEERKKAWKTFHEERRRLMLRRYDADGDGQLSDAERKAMHEDRRRPWQATMDRWRLQHFDADGDGKISEDEKAAVRAFEKDMEKVGQQMQLALFDLDGDGEVTREERVANRRRWAMVGLRMMTKARQYMDMDDDGQVSWEESRAFRERMHVSFVRWADAFMERFDTDRSGRLDETERAKMLGGLLDDFHARVKRHDADGNGLVAPHEAEKLLEEFAREINVIPKFKPEPDAKGG